LVESRSLTQLIEFFLHHNEPAKIEWPLLLCSQHWGANCGGFERFQT
jgi:hypothetical protein